MKLMKTLLFGATMLVMAACGGNKEGEAKADAHTPESDGAKAAELIYAYQTAETPEAREKAEKELMAFQQEVEKLYGEDEAAQQKFREAYQKKVDELSQKMMENMKGGEMQMMEGEDIEMPEGVEEVSEEVTEVAEAPKTL